MRNDKLEQQRRNHDEDREPNEQPLELITDARRVLRHARFYEAADAFSGKRRHMETLPRVEASQPQFKGRVFSVRTDTIVQDGKRSKVDIVDHAGSFAIAALPAPGRLLLVRQYRHAARKYLWEIPAGTAEESEACEHGARRELREETGFSADEIEELCCVYPTPGFCTERVHVYVARGLHAGDQQLDEDEQIEVAEFSFEEAWSMQASGEIVDMKTVLALLWLEGRQ